MHKDPKTFAVALTKNHNHYSSKEARKVLRVICNVADQSGGEPGTIRLNTCVEIFDTKLEQMRGSRPDYFKDEFNIPREIQKLQNDINNLNEAVKPLQKNQGLLQKNLDLRNRDFRENQKEIQKQFSQIQSNNLNLEKVLSKQLQERETFFTKILFDIPIIGRFFRQHFNKKS